VYNSLRIGLIITSFAISATVNDRIAGAADSDNGSTTAPKVKHKKKTSHEDSADTGLAADNTGVNKRDRKESESTADQQKNDKTDLDLTARIRRSIMKDKDLSTNAHNVKIIAQDGKVTLKGPVASSAEKKVVEDKAAAVAGSGNVTSEIEIKQ
jgi:hyperosmotically inducible protein